MPKTVKTAVAEKENKPSPPEHGFFASVETKKKPKEQGVSSKA